MTSPNNNTIPVCTVDDILPNTGVCALVDSQPVAIFRVTPPSGADNQFYAIDNIDPKNGANVLSRGLVGSLGDQVVVASPLYKHHFNLATGQCLENSEYSVRAHHLYLKQNAIYITLNQN